MKNRGKQWAVAGLVVMGLLLAGCADNQVDPGDEGGAPIGVTTEEEAIRYYAANDEFVVNDEETFADRELMPADAGSFGKVDISVTPLRFGRIITGITKTVETSFEPGDSIAIAHITKDIAGIFKILTVTTANETVLVEKPFNDRSERNVVFRRVARRARTYWRNWVPVASSLVQGGTLPPNDGLAITKLELIGPNETIEITDPQDFYLRYGWVRMNQLRATMQNGDVPQFTGGQEFRIRVTLESTSPDTDFVALRYGFMDRHWKRFPMTMVEEAENGGVYTRVFETNRTRPVHIHFHHGWFNMGIDAVTRETLYDDQAPYAASWWGIPYRVF